MKKLNLKKVVVFALILLLLIGSTILATNTLKKKMDDYKTIEISVYDKNNSMIYDKKVTTKEVKLIDALSEIDGLTMETQDSQYGKFVTSINGIKQEENYYWSYYVNDEYARVGVSEYVIQNNDKIKFVLEKLK